MSLIGCAALYALAAWWCLRQRDTFRDVFEFPVSVVAVLAVASVLINVGLRPLRYRLLLARYAIRPSFADALKDRAILLAAKTLLPTVVGDPTGFVTVTRKWRMDAEETTGLWATDKVLFVVVQVALVAAGGLARAMPVWAAITLAMGALAVATLLPGSLHAPVPAGSRDGPGGPRPGTSFLRLVALLGRGLRGLGGLRAYPRGHRLALVLSVAGSEVVEFAGFAVALSLATGVPLGSLDLLDVVLVNGFGALPTAFGGAGARELAAMLLLPGGGDSRAVLLVAFLSTLVMLQLPALAGVPLIRGALVARRPRTPS